MKRLSSIFLLALFFLASSRPAQAETFIISYLDADSVIVDGRTCRVDSSFNLTSKTRIDWGKASLLEAYSTATGLMRTFACPKEEKDLKWTERLYRKTLGAFADFYPRLHRLRPEHLPLLHLLPQRHYLRARGRCGYHHTEH